jgi:hypothetical protein
MFELNGTEFLRAMTTFGAMMGFLRSPGNLDGAEHNLLRSHDRQKFLASAQEIHHVAVAFGSASSAMPVKRLIASLGSSEPITYRSVRELTEAVLQRLIDDMGGCRVLLLGERNAPYFDPPTPHFGEEVATKFPSISYEIQEAGKCLALERSTAAAFHAIRCLEGGIRALSRCVGIPDPTKGADRSWFKLLAAIKREMDRRWPSSADRVTGDGHTFEVAYAALAGIQNPWRNATMHLDQKYTQEEARGIFDVVGGFMKRLAFRCDENGEPLA